MTKQQAVNGDVREAADTFDYLWRTGLDIWNSMPEELHVFILMVFTISVLMQWGKKALIYHLPKRERVKWLWFASLPLGCALAMVGWAVTDDYIHETYWLIIGLTVGSTAMGVHFVTMKAVVPLVRVVWSRVLLAARGK